MNASEIAVHNVKKREYQKQYMDYWNSTAELTDTGRPVDGVICPAAPHAAVLPCKYDHTGYSSFVNLLDYTSVGFPVTRADKNIDVPQPVTEFLSDMDRTVYDACKWIVSSRAPCIRLANHRPDDADAYDGAPAGLQLIGRRLQEEKVLTLAEYISANVAKSL